MMVMNMIKEWIGKIVAIRINENHVRECDGEGNTGLYDSLLIVKIIDFAEGFVEVLDDSSLHHDSPEKTFLIPVSKIMTIQPCNEIYLRDENMELFKDAMRTFKKFNVV